MKPLAYVTDILSRDPRTLPPVLRHGVRVIQFGLNTWKQFEKNHGLIRASGLAYSTLLALVPLVVVIFSFFTAFGAIDNLKQQIQQTLIGILIPARQDEILTYVNQFTANAQALGIVGFATFVLTSVLLLSNIERNFNEIWGIHATRSFLNKLTTYTAVLVLGTLLITASFALTAGIDTFLEQLGIREITIVFRFLTRLFPTLFILAAFLLVIMQVPATQVQFTSALLGAAIGAVLWELARTAFATWVNTSMRNSVIYGSLAIIPIFLLWLFVGWNIVLIALEASFVHQHIQKSSTENYLEISTDSENLLLGLGIFVHISRRFHNGDEPPSLKELANTFLVSPTDIDMMVRLFEERHLMRPADDVHWAFAPARSLSRITVTEIIRVILGDVKVEMLDQFTCELQATKTAERILAAALGTVEGMTMLDLVLESEKEEPAGRSLDEGKKTG